jgi:hypothetical protein
MGMSFGDVLVLARLSVALVSSGRDKDKGKEFDERGRTRVGSFARTIVQHPQAEEAKEEARGHTE